MHCGSESLGLKNAYQCPAYPPSKYNSAMNVLQKLLLMNNARSMFDALEVSKSTASRC